MKDRIALVDLNDNITGYETKAEVHRRGLLHRAFSVFIIKNGKMLIQMRNPDKYHSGGLWSNACCSHQRIGEELSDSVHRRMQEELGFDCALEEKFTFIYRTEFRPGLIEYEFDHVFVGDYGGEVHADPEEAAEIRWILLGDLKAELVHSPEKFSSWFIISAPRVIAEVEGHAAQAPGGATGSEAHGLGAEARQCGGGESREAGLRDAAGTTLAYYDSHSAGFAADTLDVEFTEVQDRFLSYLAPGARILDLGCGAGRDSRYFASKGFEVEAVDGSAEMVRIASRNAGVPVRQMLFAELDERDRYDGIFACASLLHVPLAELPDIFARIRRALKPGGIVYVSFKYGTFEGERGGRYFTDMTKERLEAVLREADAVSAAPTTRAVIVPDGRADAAQPGGQAERQKQGNRPADVRLLKPIECWLSADVRPGRENERWLNAILRRET